jgi:hypothetical protein
MSKTVGDFFVERLYEWGVRTIFGYPGDGINGVLGALDRAGGKIGSSRCGTRKWRPSWPPRTPSSPASRASACRPAAPARRTW